MLDHLCGVIAVIPEIHRAGRGNPNIASVLPAHTGASSMPQICRKFPPWIPLRMKGRIMRMVGIAVAMTASMLLAGCFASPSGREPVAIQGVTDPAAKHVSSRVTRSSPRVARAATRVRHASATVSHPSTGISSNGVASYYRAAGLTAAHRTLPFGTRVKVTNVKTGRSVIVRINDRGPFIHGRSIDLSQGAAEEVGMTQAGIAQVRMEVVK
jgi:peptidoglycan lytic transglycosylase